MVERIAHARAQAQRETYDRLAPEFTPARCVELDAAAGHRCVAGGHAAAVVLRRTR